MCPRKSPSTWDLGCQPFPASVLMCKSSKGRGRWLQSRGGGDVTGCPRLLCARRHRALGTGSGLAAGGARRTAL